MVMVRVLKSWVGKPAIQPVTSVHIKAALKVLHVNERERLPLDKRGSLRGC